MSIQAECYYDDFEIKCHWAVLYCGYKRICVNTSLTPDSCQKLTKKKKKQHIKKKDEGARKGVVKLCARNYFCIIVCGAGCAYYSPAAKAESWGEGGGESGPILTPTTATKTTETAKRANKSQKPCITNNPRFWAGLLVGVMLGNKVRSLCLRAGNFY